MSHRQTANLTAQYKYGLTYLRRGAYGSIINSHANGAAFARLDGSQFAVPYTSDQIGIHVKLPAFNPWQVGVQDLSTVTAYQFTIPAPPPPRCAKLLRAAKQRCRRGDIQLDADS